MRRITQILAGIALSGALAISAMAQTGQVGVALQSTHSNEASSKFDQYRSLPEGFVFSDLGLAFDGKLYFDLKGHNLGLQDQDAELTFGRYGLWRVEMGWNQTLRRYGSQAQSIFGTDAPGRFLIPDSVQAAAQPYIVTTAPPTGDNVAAFSALFGALYGQTPWREVGTERDLGTLSARCISLPGWTFDFSLRNENRDGTFPMINGFYHRYNNAAGDHNRNFNVELPAPVDYQTTDWTASVAYDHKIFGVALAYSDSQFRNDVNTLSWDHPWRLTDAVSTAGVIGGSSKGFLDWNPDNDARSLSLQTHLNLPLATRLTGSYIRGKMTQNQAFLPFSVNSQLRDATTGLYATDMALLPARSLNGEVVTTALSFDAVSTPVHPLTLHARYESYDYSNRTHELVMPGTSTYGDSYWVTRWGGSPIESHPNSYDRDRLSFDATWRVVKGLRLAAGFEREEWSRELRTVDETRENIHWVRIAANPVDWFEAKASYTWRKHRYEGGYHGHHEYAAFRMFDVADRNTRQWSLDLAFYPVQGLDINLYANSRNHDFVGTTYGLQYDKGYDLGAGATYSTGRYTVYGNLSRNRNSNFLQTLSKSDLNGSATYDVRNTWFSHLRDTVDVASLGCIVDVVANKATLEFHYSYQQGRGQRDDSNVATLRVDNAQAFPFPDTKDTNHVLEGKFTYVLNAKWSLGARLMYDSFDLNDYAVDRYGAFNPNLNDPSGRFQIHPQFLMNAKYGDYNGTVASVFARYTF